MSADMATLVVLLACLVAAVAGWQACVSFRVEPLQDELRTAQDERDAARVGQVRAWGEVAEVNRDLGQRIAEVHALRAQSDQRGHHVLSLVALDGRLHEGRRALQRQGGAW